MEPDHIHTEDAFTVDEEGWITLPNNGGRVSPEGIVYDKDGNELLSIYDESPSRPIVYDYTQEDYEWI